MASLGQLKATNASDILLVAARLIKTRGWSRLAPRDARTGALDVLGAFCVAAGAREADVCERDDLIPYAVPPARQAAVHVALEALSAVLGEDAIQWQWKRTNPESDLVNALKVAAFTLSNAISD
jgi:hypothetical protein